mgnify:CR=1 FL=1
MAETENFALEVIKRIHHELGTENSADKLKLVIKIIAEETRSASADIYVKADDVTLEHIAGFPQNGSRPAVRIVRLRAIFAIGMFRRPDSVPVGTMYNFNYLRR